MTIQINLTNRWLYTLVAMVFCLVLVAVVYSYTDLTGVGHDATSVGVVINGVEKNLQQAVDDGDFTFTFDLVYGQHTSSQCTGLSGEVRSTDDVQSKFCRFSSSACPAGWAKFKGWSITVSNSVSCQMSCTDPSINTCPAPLQTFSCNTGGHSAWSNIPLESCVAGGDCGFLPTLCYSLTCPVTGYANITQIGCY